MSNPHLIPADQHPRALQVLGEAVTIFGQNDAAKPFEVHLQEGINGGGPPPHHHPWDEAFYVLEGEVTLTVGEQTSRLSAGAFAHIPAGTVHAYTNATTPTRLLAVVSDCRGGEVFALLDQQVKQLPRDLDKLSRINARYGVVFV